MPPATLPALMPPSGGEGVATGAAPRPCPRPPFVTTRRHDHALVDCQDARGYHSRGDIHGILSAGLPALVEREVSGEWPAGEYRRRLATGRRREGAPRRGRTLALPGRPARSGSAVTGVDPVPARRKDAERKEITSFAENSMTSKSQP